MTNARPFGLVGRTGKLPFDIVTIQYGGRPREACRYTCVSCGETTHDFVAKSSNTRSITPDAHFKKLTQQGWQKGKNQTAICPKCTGYHKDDEEENNDYDATVAIVEEVEEVLLPEYTSEQTPETLRNSTGLTSTMNQMTAYVAPAMTSEQRLNIRSALDKSFDDAKGMYLDGMNDAKIAEALKVPRIWVETIRETAYGPIRITPEVLGLKNDLLMALNSLADLNDKFVQLRARLDDIEKGM